VYSEGGGYPEKSRKITTCDMGFSYELFYLNTETESLGEVQGFGMQECRSMGCTIQWRKGGGYPKEPGYKQNEMWYSRTLLLFCV